MNKLLIFKIFTLYLVLLAQHVGAKQMVSIGATDTFSYRIPKGTKKYIDITSFTTNVAIALYNNDTLINIQDESKGIGSVERIWVDTDAYSNPTIKIWATAYLKEIHDYKVTISTSNKWYPISKEINKKELIQDLNQYFAIKKSSHPGTLLYHDLNYWDSIQHTYIQKIIRTDFSILDAYCLFSKLASLEGSCHNFSRLPNALHYYFPLQLLYIPIAVYYQDNTLYNQTSNLDLPIGAKILSINNIQIHDILKDLPAMVQTDGMSAAYKNINAFHNNWVNYFHLQYGTFKEYIINYEWENKQQKVVLQGLDYKEALSRTTKKPLETNESRYSFEQLDDQIFYLKIKSFDFAWGKDDPAYSLYETFLENMMDTLEKYPNAALVIDIRGNTGGTGVLYEKTFTYLTKRPFRDSNYAYMLFNQVPHVDKFIVEQFFIANQLRHASDANVHLQERFTNNIQGKYYLKDAYNPLILPNERTFEGALFLLIDAYVASAAAHLASLIKSYTNAIVIGEETNGGYYEHIGHYPFSYTLPNSKIQIGFSTVYVNQDAKQLDDQSIGSGVMPHYVVPTYTLQNKATIDLGLEKVKELLQ